MGAVVPSSRIVVWVSLKDDPDDRTEVPAFRRINVRPALADVAELAALRRGAVPVMYNQLRLGPPRRAPGLFCSLLEQPLPHLAERAQSHYADLDPSWS